MKTLKMFLVEKGTFVVIRNTDGVEVSFESFEQYYKYCPRSEFNIDIDEKWYIDYEPERNLYIEMEDGISDYVDKMNKIPVIEYENIIDNVQKIKDRFDDQYYDISVEEAKIVKLNEVKAESELILTTKWPLWKQINIEAGIYDNSITLKQEKDADIRDIIRVHDVAEKEINSALDKEKIKSIKVGWPQLL